MAEKIYKNFWGQDTSKLRYKAPSDEVFKNMQQAFLQVWSKYAIDGLVNETVETAKKLTNVRENYTWFFTKCDRINQHEFLELLSTPAQEYILRRVYFRELSTAMIKKCVLVEVRGKVKKDICR